MVLTDARKFRAPSVVGLRSILPTLLLECETRLYDINHISSACRVFLAARETLAPARWVLCRGRNTAIPSPDSEIAFHVYCCFSKDHFILPIPPGHFRESLTYRHLRAQHAALATDFAESVGRPRTSSIRSSDARLTGVYE